MEEVPQSMDSSLRGLLGAVRRRPGHPLEGDVQRSRPRTQVIAHHFPTAMVFVPGSEGHSHSPDEYTPPEQMIAGVRVLAEALRGCHPEDDTISQLAPRRAAPVRPGL